MHCKTNFNFPCRNIMMVATLLTCAITIGILARADAGAPAATTSSSGLKLLAAGMQAEAANQSDLANTEYLAAYAAGRGDATLSQRDRLNIARKYVSALLRDPAKFHTQLVAYAKTVLADQPAPKEFNLLALNVAGTLLHRSLSLPAKEQNKFLWDIVSELDLPMPAWDPGVQGAFIMSMTARDQQIAIGTEDNGVWIYDQATGNAHHYTVRDGLGDDDAYAVTYDRLGRLWVGHLNHGVSVFNGKTWQNYLPADGPIGSRVFAIATSPVDGDVWIATDSGVTRYSLENHAWHSYTIADGLPSNQATCLAFDRRGTLYIGTNCDGIAIGTLRDDYTHWRRVDGPDEVPNAPDGNGLPSNLINALLVTSNNTVWAGTPCGLAHSTDSGVTWEFKRGEDWGDKIRGLRHGPSLNPNHGNHLLLEDYVSCLTEGGDGNLYIGYRQKNYEVLDPTTDQRLYPQTGDVLSTLYLYTLLPLESGYVLLARYGEGVRQEMPFAGGHRPGALRPFAASENPMHQAALPTPAAAPTAEALTAMAGKVKSSSDRLAPGTGYYLGEDWETEGDWDGRYGRQFAVLCAARSPLDDDIQAIFPFKATGQLGPNHDAGDGLRHWVHWVKTDNPRCLYDPIPGYRRQAEWDDHGETYATTHEGPDIWILVAVPEGVHCVSMYFVNKDGHDGDNRSRDYLVELRQYAPTPDDAERLAPMARARVRAFWGGVYEKFVVAGPGKFWLKVAKNNSMNTIVSSVFIDELIGPKRPSDRGYLGWMGGVHYDPPNPNATASADPHLLDKLLDGTVSARQDNLTHSTTQSRFFAARQLWETLDAPPANAQAAAQQRRYRLLAYRTAKADNAPNALLENWRWKLLFWLPTDRVLFANTMANGHASLLGLNPQMQGLDY